MLLEPLQLHKLVHKHIDYFFRYDSYCINGSNLAILALKKSLNSFSLRKLKVKGKNNSRKMAAMKLSKHGS